MFPKFIGDGLNGLHYSGPGHNQGPALFGDTFQAAVGFLVSQTSHIEAEVVKILYPDIQYPQLVPIDTSANEWAKSITYFSQENVGVADWFNHLAKDVPLVELEREQHEETIHMAAVGYRWTMQELGFAMMIPGTNLTSDKAEAARRAYEEFVDSYVIRGDTRKGRTGLVNNASVQVINAEADGTGGSAAFAQKTATQIRRDLNSILSGIYTESLTVEMADTVLMPVETLDLLATMQNSDASDISVLEYFRRYNTFTTVTGQPLMIRGVRGLETAGGGGVGRIVAYRRDPRVVKMHIPMTHRFLPVWQTGPLIFDVPGIFRLGSVDIRRPGAFRYLDGVQAAPYE
jgi:hypothetical protein